MIFRFPIWEILPEISEAPFLILIKVSPEAIIESCTSSKLLITGFISKPLFVTMLRVPSPLLMIPSNTSFPTELIIVLVLSYPIYVTPLFKVAPFALNIPSIDLFDIFETFNCFDVLLSIDIAW